MKNYSVSETTAAFYQSLLQAYLQSGRKDLVGEARTTHSASATHFGGGAARLRQASAPHFLPRRLHDHGRAAERPLRAGDGAGGVLGGQWEKEAADEQICTR